MPWQGEEYGFTPKDGPGADEIWESIRPDLESAAESGREFVEFEMTGYRQDPETYEIAPWSHTFTVPTDAEFDEFMRDYYDAVREVLEDGDSGDALAVTGIG